MLIIANNNNNSKVATMKRGSQVLPNFYYNPDIWVLYYPHIPGRKTDTGSLNNLPETP